jgi:16S rRNA (guanine527-N7)-methyltransferase
MEQCAKFEQYLSLISKWNKTHNLTAVRGQDEIVKKHFLESLALLPHLGHSVSLLDLGTGAGFPGLPIAIMRPDCRVVVVDSSHKKVAFCQEVIRVSALQNATAVCGRAEDEGIRKLLGQFDAVVYRATWSLADYLPMAAPYVRHPGGQILAMKGPKYQQELEAITKHPINLSPPEVLSLSAGGEANSGLVVIKYRAL